jgi:biopolymer transport protein ExbB/TolQ
MIVTTVLGLVVAICTTLAHSFLQSSARSVVDVLEEQATDLADDCNDSAWTSCGNTYNSSSLFSTIIS